MESRTVAEEKCYHCGLEIGRERILFDEKTFCCQGCKSVYEILNLNNLENFYSLNRHSGVRPDTNLSQFDYLDTPEVFEKLIDFSDGGTAIVTFKIPVIHCTSCIWLLESLPGIHPDIKFTQVNFTKKTLQVSFNQEKMNLRDVAKYLASLGYKPAISLESSEKKPEKIDRSLIIKFGVAAFAFGNAMFFSIPEYVQDGEFWISRYKNLFRLAGFLLATPVVFYSASGYFKSAWYGLKNKVVNIDVPISLGIAVLYLRSIYEVLTDYGPGYFDTLCGLLFFMLLGKIFQQRTYSALSYDRDYKSFYPIAVTKIANGSQQNVLLSDLQVGDRILVRNQEIIPVDAVLINGEANIDNSFITGESAAVPKNPGDKIYAGGKQLGAVLELEVVKNVDQSYLTQLWNKDAFRKKETGLDTVINRISKYFTFVILGITALAALYWFRIDAGRAWQVVSAILIVACPCALALAAPFTLGHVMRILGRHRFYVKDTHTIEKLSGVDTLVFDKTGTITHSKKSEIQYAGKELPKETLEDLKSLLKNSTHPLSKALYEHLAVEDPYLPAENFAEIPGKGYSAEVRGNAYTVGSASLSGQKAEHLETAVYISRGGIFLGKFVFKNEYRPGLEDLFSRLKNYKIHILSGDNEAERQNLENIVPRGSKMAFDQSPEDKLDYIQNIQNQGDRVAMFGDGLNDAGALKQSDVGIAIAEDTNTFTPSSDVIMHGGALVWADKFLKMSKDAMRIVKITVGISFLYNIIGLSFAVSGHLSPLVAAILMPASSITVVVFTSLASWAASVRNFGGRGI